MKPWVRATRDTVGVVGAGLGISWLASYAAQHPHFATNVLLPILGVLFLVGIWGFFYLMAKIR